MKSLQLFDPPMCCPTGVCGPEIDPVLPAMAGWLQSLQRAGVRIERYNLAQQPLAFLQHTEVKRLLDTRGTEGLPVLFIDGVLALQGRYPNEAERDAWKAASTS